MPTRPPHWTKTPLTRSGPTRHPPPTAQVLGSQTPCADATLVWPHLRASGHNCLGRREEGRERRGGDRTENFELRKYNPSKMTLRASLLAQRVNNPPAMQETRARFLGPEDPPEKEMATHSLILAWKIPWTEEPGRLQSIGS